MFLKFKLKYKKCQTRIKEDKMTNSSSNGTKSTSSETLSLWPESSFEENILDVTGLIQVKANALRSQKPVNWLPYLHAGLISCTEYSFITAFQEAKSREERDKLLNYFEKNSFSTLVTVAQRVCIVSEIQKFLLMIDDMLWEDISRVQLFQPQQTEPWKAFYDLLSCSDGFVRNIASRIICKLIAAKDCIPTDTVLDYFLKWLKNELMARNEYLLSVARCLQRLLTVDEYRQHFYKLNGFFEIIKLLSTGVKYQAQYQLIYCLWVSSFNWEIAENLNNFSTIPVLMTLLEQSPIEIIKVPRVIMATFRNLLEKPREEGVKKHHAFLMVQCHIIKYIESMQSCRKITNDPEFWEDNKAVQELVTKYVAALSTFDEYRLELKSRHLEWSLVHTSKTFWKKNAQRLNQKNYELLKILVSLLETSTEPTVLSVAAHDLSEYMSHYPGGKIAVERLGAKNRLLSLLNNEDATVRYHALRSVQILMLNSCDLLSEYVSIQQISAWNEDESFSL